MEALAGIEADIESYFGEQDQQKSSPDGCKQVPWLSWEEWDSVRESLFSSSPDRIASTLERVMLFFTCFQFATEIGSSLLLYRPESLKLVE